MDSEPRKGRAQQRELTLAKDSDKDVVALNNLESPVEGNLFI